MRAAHPAKCDQVRRAITKLTLDLALNQNKGATPPKVARSLLEDTERIHNFLPPPASLPPPPLPSHPYSRKLGLVLLMSLISCRFFSVLLPPEALRFCCSARGGTCAPPTLRPPCSNPLWPGISFPSTPWQLPFLTPTPSGHLPPVPPDQLMTVITQTDDIGSHACHISWQA